MRRFIQIAFASVAVMVPAMASAAPSLQTPTSGHIVELNTGWNSNMLTIRLDNAYYNPANCQTNYGQYATEIGDPGNPTNHAAILAAFLAGKPVFIWVDPTACSTGRPRINGVTITQ